LAASTLSPVSGLISVSPDGNKVGQVVIWMGALVTVTGMLVGIGLGSSSGTRYTGVRSDGRSVSSIVGVAGTLGVVAVGGGTVDVAEGSGVAVGKASVGVGEGTVGVAVGQVSVAVGGGTVGVNVGNAWLGKAATVGLTSDTSVDAAVGVATGLACGPHLASDRPNASKVQQMRERSQTGIIDRVARAARVSVAVPCPTSKVEGSIPQIQRNVKYQALDLIDFDRLTVVYCLQT